MESINWQKNLEKFTKKYRSKFNSIFMVGSLVYGAKFKPTSDIDLIIIIDNLEQWKFACKEFCNEDYRFVNDSISLKKENKGQYFCLKCVFDNIAYSIDFIEKSTFSNMIDSMYTKKTITYNKITNKRQDNSYLFGSGAYRLEVPKENIEYKQCNTVSSPLIIKKDKKYFMGILPDKILTGYVWLSGSSITKSKVELFIKYIIKLMHENSHITSIPDILTSLNRYRKLPEKHIDKLTQYCKRVFNE